MDKRKWISGAIAALVSGMLLGSAAVRAAALEDSEQVSKLLSEAKTLAFQLKEDAVLMEGYNRTNVSPQTQAAAINRIKDDVNALGKQAAKLKDARAAASPWQKAAIDRVTPFLDELGGYTTAVIEHLNSEHKHNFEEFKDYLEANADYATDLAAMIGDFVDYGKTKDRLDRLATKLEIPKR